MNVSAEQPANILLVDDRPSNLLYLQQVLSNPSYNLVLAHSGPEALTHLAAGEFAVVLLDVAMPGMDGFEVATRMQELEGASTTPIIFVTAHGDTSEWSSKAYGVGAVDFLQKPIDRHVVRGKVGVFVQLFRQRKQIEHQSALLREAERRDRELELTRVRLEHEQQYRNLAEALPNVIWTASSDGRITYLNGRWTKETGLSETGSLGNGWLAALHPDDTAVLGRQWHHALAKGEPLHIECRLRTASGSFRWFLCRALPTFAPDGGIARWIGSFTEIHEQKQAHEVSLTGLRLRDEFLAIASHELRTPLTSLRLQADALLRKLHQERKEAPECIERRAEAIGRQVGRLSLLIDNLLDVSRITAGRLKLDRECFDLVEDAREVTDRLSESARQAGSELRFQATNPVMAFVDRLRFEQVVTNLVSNAIKYGEGKPIEVSVGMAGDDVQLSVRDQGIGIDSQHIERIFGRFERAASPDNYGGLGLGLYIARQIMDAHGGQLEVSSHPGTGAVFTATFPRPEPKADPAGGGAST